MNCIVAGNSLQLPIGTKFSIHQQSLVNKQLNLINGSKLNEFFAIFGEIDVDFEIWCDNRESDRGILMTLVVNGKPHDPFYFWPKMLTKIKTLENFHGRKLHFISQNTEDGRLMVAQTALKYGIGYEMASIICSKIKIRIEIEQLPNKINYVSLIGNEIQLFVRTLTGKTITVAIGLNNTVNDLKMIIAKREGIETKEQRLIYDGEQLTDHRQLEYYNITIGSTIQLLLRLCGGKDTDSVTSSIDSSNSNTNAIVNSSSSQLFSGERGVVCYGQISDQEWKPHYGFKADSNITVNSVVIEMRMESRFAPI